MDIEWCDSESLTKLAESTENERKRLAGWAYDTELKNNSRIQSQLLHKCRRLAKIRDELLELAECYKD